MNDDIWKLSQEIRNHLQNNPENTMIFIRSQSYRMVPELCMLCGFDLRELVFNQIEFALEMGKITDKEKVYELACNIWKFHTDVYDDFLDRARDAKNDNNLFGFLYRYGLTDLMSHKMQERYDALSVALKMEKYL